MSDKIRPTIILVCVICLALGAYWLLKPSPETRIIPKQEIALGFAFAIDPHLFLTVEPVSRNSQQANSSDFLLVVRARNTAAGDLKINLTALRFAVIEENSGFQPTAANWSLEDGKPLSDGLLLPGQEANGEVRLRLPEQTTNSAVIIWREEKFYKWLPFMRESVLNSRLRIEMADLIQTAN